MMSMAGPSSVDALLNPLSTIVHTMFVEARVISLVTEMRPVAGSVNAEVITDTSGTVTVVASEMITTGTNFTVLGSPVEV